jgi:hypothetical protein
LEEWGNIIKMDLEEIEWEIVDWVCVTDDSDQWLAVVNTVVTCQVPYSAGNFAYRHHREDLVPWS